VYNGTFVIEIRPPGAQVEIIFGADPIHELPVRRESCRTCRSHGPSYLTEDKIAAIPFLAARAATGRGPVS
jgi:hypothetical protein